MTADRMRRLLASLVTILALTVSIDALAYNLRPFPQGKNRVMKLNLGTSAMSFIGGNYAWNDAGEGAMFNWNQTGIGPGLDHSFFALSNASSGDPCGAHCTRWGTQPVCSIRMTSASR